MKDILMKGLALNEDERLIFQTVQAFCQKEIAPLAAEIDRDERFPWETIEKIKELGLAGLFIPEEYGGNPVSKTAWVAIMKEIAKACMATSLIFCTIYHSSYFISLLGTPEQKKKFLPPYMEGIVGSICITESGAGSDVRGMRTMAVKQSDGFLMNGTKTFVTNGDVAKILTIFSKVKENDEILGINPIVITSDMPGFSVGKKEEKLGMRASGTAEVILEDCNVPDDHLLGKPGDGFKALLTYLNESRPNVAAQAVGVAEAAFEASVTYANTRIQFGRRIIENQGVLFMIAEMATQLHAAWQMLLHVARLMDEGHKDYSTESSIVKLFASEMAEKVTSNAILIHGGYGYCRDYPVERMYRDAKLLQIYEGTSHINKVVIGRRFLEKI
ncbi:MAG: acyl-CoA dehydrogenase family protein [Pseudomonadota bacterium]